MLQAVVAALDRCTSPPVQRPQQALHASEYAAEFDAKALGPASNWMELANRLRWLRGHFADFELWGAALGRLRWIASRDGDVHKATLRSLQPSFRLPTRGHVALGCRQRERRRRFDELVPQTPAADAPADDFVRWLVGLFALADAIKSSDLERVTRPRRERIAELAPSPFAERHDRRRRAIRAHQPRPLRPVPAAPRAPLRPDGAVRRARRRRGPGVCATERAPIRRADSRLG
jgi:hypothetical protein